MVKLHIAIFLIHNIFVFIAPSTIPNINGIEIDDIVFDEGIQYINASKQFTEDVYVFGNVQVDKLNSKNLSKIYDNSILIDKNNYFSNGIVRV